MSLDANKVIDKILEENKRLVLSNAMLEVRCEGLIEENKLLNLEKESENNE